MKTLLGLKELTLSQRSLSGSLFLIRIFDVQPCKYQVLQLLPTTRQKYHLVSEDLVRTVSWTENRSRTVTGVLHQHTTQI